MVGSLLALALPLLGAPPADAIVSLRVSAPPAHGEVPDAMPLRFVLLDGGQVFVGGTSELASARLEKKELKDLEKQIERVRKLPGLTGPQKFGPGDRSFLLTFRKQGEVLVQGEPAQAPASLRPLAALVDTLLSFDHPGLRTYRPDLYFLSAHEAALPGGCREWQLPVALPEVLRQPRAISASAATSGWPTGGTPASVCAADKRYAVTLRPLVPGETP
jgi:hypothetical protein